MFEYGIQAEDICTNDLEPFVYRDDYSKVVALKHELANNINNGYETIVAVSNGRIYTFKINSGENYNFYFCTIVNLAEKLYLAKEDGAQAYKGKLRTLSKRKAKKLGNSIDLPNTRNSLIGILKSLKNSELGELSYKALEPTPEHFHSWLVAFHEEGNIASESYVKAVLGALDKKANWKF